MPYQTSGAKKRANRKPINKNQNEFSKGYISTFANSRRPENSVSDATNMELVADNIFRPRPSLKRYGSQPVNVVIGRGKYRYNGVRGQFFMLNVGGVGRLYWQVNGGAFNLVAGVNSYSTSGWAMVAQSKSRAYIYNGVNTLTYVNLATMTTVEYVSLGTPPAPTATASANLISGTKSFGYYYKWTANNVVGESAASPATAKIEVNDIRDNWGTAAGKTVTVNGTLVPNATSYTLYGGSDPQNLNEIITISNPTTLVYTDDGSATLNPFKTAPSSNSTAGPVFTYMYVDNRNAQAYGVTSDNKLYYSATFTEGPADFSSLNGGGFTTIDDGGDTQLNFVDGFRTGKGDPVITTSSRGSAGKGRINHVTFESATYGDQVIFYPNVSEANGQSGTYAPRATVKARDGLIYPTGDNIKNTGTSQNVVNILTTNNLGDLIIPDINKLNLTALQNAAGCEYQDKVYFALPVGSTTNNEIWVLDMARKNAWMLRWTVAAKDIWLYEDSAGASHLCVLVNNVIMEFSRAGVTPHTDDGVAFRSRVAFSSLVWDESGISLGRIKNQYFKLLEPTGNITANTYGLSKRGSTVNTGFSTYSVDVSPTGYDVLTYDGDTSEYDAIVGVVDTFAQSVAVLHVRPKGLLNEESWEIVSESAGTDFQLAAVSTRGTANTDLVFKGLS